MNRLVSDIIDAGYADHVLSDRQMARIIGGSDDRRYGRVKRAMQSGDLVRVKRGMYVVANRFRTQPVHPFALAHAIVVGSYVSMESALGFHGWIPEAVFQTVSITPGRKSIRVHSHVFGDFEFNPLAVNPSGFLAGVERHVLDGQPCLIASPLRAVLDIAAFRKEKWQGLDWLTSGLRIDMANLLSLRRSDFKALQPVYKHKAVTAFLAQMEAAIFELKAQRKDVT